MGRGNTKKKTKGSPGLNRKESGSFFTANRNKPGIVETVSGLQYAVVERGEGPVPDEACTVQVHQRISLLDGSIIADTYRKNLPETFSMKEAIPGYREGLMLMNTGSRFKFFIPPELAWGKRGAGNLIGPNAALVIDARLVGVTDSTTKGLKL